MESTTMSLTERAAAARKAFEQNWKNKEVLAALEHLKEQAQKPVYVRGEHSPGYYLEFCTDLGHVLRAEAHSRPEDQAIKRYPAALELLLRAAMSDYSVYEMEKGVEVMEVIADIRKSFMSS